MTLFPSCFFSPHYTLKDTNPRQNGLSERASERESGRTSKQASIRRTNDCDTTVHKRLRLFS